MSSVPNEILEDVLLPLDRWTLDDARFTDGRFLQLVTNHMSGVCLRQIKTADFRAPSGNGNTNWTSSIRIDGPPDRELRSEHADAAALFSEFVQALRSSRVAYLTFNGLAFTPQLAALVLQTPVVTDWLGFFAGSFAALPPAQYRELLLHFSPTSLNITGCSMRPSQLAERLLGVISENRLDGGSSCMTDDAIIDFCLQPEAQTDKEGGAASKQKVKKLKLHKGSFTKDLFKRLVEASSASMRTRPLRIVMGTVRFKQEDLRDFAQHLSTRERAPPYMFAYRGQLDQERIYDFPGEQQGAAAAVHLQIVLYPSNRLEMIRARHPNIFFRE